MSRHLNYRKVFLGLILLTGPSFFYSQIEEYYPYKISASASNYGNTGILELPNARFMQEASLRFNFSSSFPNEFTSLTASPFDWMEATYRYVEIKNRNYGPANYSGNQSAKDKGFDIKIKLLTEDNIYPSVAMGLRDLAGTAVFASEYIVASKRLGNFDLTGGVGWGILGSAGNFSNPFYSLGDSFKVREYGDTEGGSFSPKSWFSGDASLLAGVEYDLLKYGLKLKLEYDTTYPERSDPTLNTDSRFNLGLSYFFSKNLNFGLAFERGNQFRVSFSLTGNFLKDSIPKPKPRTVLSLSDKQKENAYQNKEVFYRSLNKSLKDELIYIQAANYKEEEVDVAIATTRFQSIPRSVGRTVRIVSALTKDDVKKINVRSMNGDIEVGQLSIDREEFDKANIYKSSFVEVLSKSSISSFSNDPLYESADFMPTVNFPEFNWSMSPSIKHQIGGPEGFYLGQLFWKTDASLKFDRNLILYSSFGINIYDTFNELNNPSGSTIPHVRSDIQDYLKEGKNNLIRLQLQYFNSPYKDVFVRADLGILEEMFGGLGGEVLYRPIDKRYAVGFSLHKVKQRGFKQRFSFRDYSNTTGHLSFYYDLPIGINSQISVGEYLAGDKGLTIDFSRRFKSGFTLGVFATKTNLSAEEFGEGSFDKGFYIAVPTKMLYSDYTSGNISFGLHPLTKDGGAFLTQHNSLFSILGDTNSLSVRRDWKDILD